MIHLSLALALIGPGQARPHLLLEDLEGRQTELSTAGLALTDPRERGAWIVRPVGFEAASADEHRAGPQAELELVNGDELLGRVRSGHGEILEFELSGGVVVPCELSDIARLSFPDLIPEGQRTSLERAREGDRLYRRTAAALDLLEGTLEGFLDDGVRFDSVLGQRTIPWNEVAVVFLEAVARKERATPDARVPVSVELAEGGRVRGGLVAIEPERCRLVLGGKNEVSLPLAEIAEIQVVDGRLTYLSALEPGAETGRGTPFGDELGLTWPHRMDRNVLGTALRAGGLLFRRGVGMHAPSKLTFPLDGGYTRLRGRVAIDDSSLLNAGTARGSVVFRLWLDGKVAWESPVQRGGDPALALPLVDLSGKRELALEVDPAGDFAGDRADWIGLALIR